MIDIANQRLSDG